ncbi:hypothetical protein [uncultured Stenotrophomonas sp.]|uniref:hypothetical protein n=1 Tax=uncultured Stenotrophomonas sp. TaxID=165438 RepID=UPI0025EB7A4A|nr:hypothetical protein [uncultured Stenotrophomonas sp.]
MSAKMTYFSQHLDYITKVTEALNQVPANDDLYIGVTLYESDTHRKIGEWSDEIATGAWYYEEEP